MNSKLISIKQMTTTKPILIAGPCSAESAEQILTTAHALQGMGVRVMRAGVWKPRTSPQSFAGVGDSALPWLREAEGQTALPMATEVATPQHLQAAVQAGLRYLWIGARTTSNPFMVQQLADFLKDLPNKTNLTILVKNPISPDLDLWLGAIERIQKAGITHLMAVHRGFSTTQPTELRNQPLWSIPIELKRRLPHIPLLCDASHIAGRADLVPTIAQHAINLRFDGLMIEVHPTPETARSDAQQQLSLPAFQQLLDDLIIPQQTPADAALLKWREQIDEIDSQLVALIAERLSIVRQIGQFKKENNLSVLQTDRYTQLLQQWQQRAEQYGIDPNNLKRIIETIHDEALRQQL